MSSAIYPRTIQQSRLSHIMLQERVPHVLAGSFTNWTEACTSSSALLFAYWQKHYDLSWFASVLLFLSDYFPLPSNTFDLRTADQTESWYVEPGKFDTFDGSGSESMICLHKISARERDLEGYGREESVYRQSVNIVASLMAESTQEGTGKLTTPQPIWCQ